MKFNTGFSYKRPTTSTAYPTQGSDNVANYGRVVEVIYDPSDKRLDKLGGTQALYGLFYQPLFQAAEEELKYSYARRFAYCGCQTERRLPVKGEIVRLQEELAASVSEEDFKSDGSVYRTCWTEIVPLWNSPHHNAYPDIPDQGKHDFGKDFKENEKVKPLQLNPGDVTLEGRHGQSLRFGGTKSSLSPIAKEDVNGKPYTILRNGQADADGNTCLEDVDKDDSSIYLTSDHKVPITEANRKFKAAKSGEIPEVAKNYQGKQIVVNSDRIVINSREDNLILSTKKHASLNAKTVSIDGEEYVGLDAKKIYLGNHAVMRENEPVLLGKTTTDHMKQFYNSLKTTLQPLSKAGQTPWEIAAVAAFSSLIGLLDERINDLPNLKSKKVYTE